MRRSLVTGIVLLSLLGACGGGKGGNHEGVTADKPTATTADESLLFYEQAPPWALADRQADRITAARLPQLKAEGNLVHYHAHLDVFYDGDAVPVPANIGIDFQRSVISPLHTHSASGVIHVEAQDDAEMTLGQFLTEWGVNAKGRCVADKCGDEVALFVNGSIQDAPVADFVIGRDTQIALVLGTPPTDIPSDYDCGAAPNDACPDTPK